MEKWLYDILRDGSLVDNRKYIVSNDIFTDYHLNTTKKLLFKGRYSNNYQKYKHDLIFSFLQKIKLTLKK